MSMGAVMGLLGLRLPGSRSESPLSAFFWAAMVLAEARPKLGRGADGRLLRHLPRPRPWHRTPAGPERAALQHGVCHFHRLPSRHRHHHGLIHRWPAGRLVLRGAGVVIAGMGLFFLVGALGPFDRSARSTASPSRGALFAFSSAAPLRGRGAPRQQRDGPGLRRDRAPADDSRGPGAGPGARPHRGAERGPCPGRRAMFVLPVAWLAERTPRSARDRRPRVSIPGPVVSGPGSPRRGRPADPPESAVALLAARRWALLTAP